MRAFAPIDLTLALRRSRLEADNAELHLRLRAAQDRIALLEGLVGCEPGEEIRPLRRRTWWRRVFGEGRRTGSAAERG